MIRYYPILEKIFELIEPRSIAKMRLDHYNYTVRRVDKRLEAGAGRDEDVWNLVIKSGILSKEEMYGNAELLMTAGTETTGKYQSRPPIHIHIKESDIANSSTSPPASLLTGLTYYLGMNRDKMKILTDEIRGRFSHSSEITLEALAGLEYLNACMCER